MLYNAYHAYNAYIEIRLEPCDKTKDRAALDERKSMVANFKASVQLMTSKVRSHTRSEPLRLSSGCDAGKCKVDRNE